MDRSGDLDDFINKMSINDTSQRLLLGPNLLSFLEDPTNQIETQDISKLVDVLVVWIQGSNFKVSSNGIDIMTVLLERIGGPFKRYIPTVFPSIIDRLGDSKDTVREKSQLLLMKLLEKKVILPQNLLDKLTAVAFVHKNAKVREEGLRCLVNILSEYGTQSMSVIKSVPSIANLLSDPAPPVRDAATLTLVELYKHVGDKLRADLKKKNLIPQSKWAMLNAQFDQAALNGDVVSLPSMSRSTSIDEVDKMSVSTSRLLMSAKSLPRPKAQSTPHAGAIDEDTFLKSFEDVPTVQIFSSKEVNEILKNIHDTISETNNDWTKRQDALKKLRSLVLAGAMNYKEFYVGLKNLEIPLQSAIKDLRSQIVRETCITLAFLARNLGNKFDKMAELLLPFIINLIQNSAKIMATAGLVTINFIIQSSPNQRLIPIITSHSTTSKSKDIRRSCCDFLAYILTEWPSCSLEKHVGLLQAALKKGIADADPEARVYSRKAFVGFRAKFPEQAEVLLQSLDPSRRRALQGEVSTYGRYGGGSSAQGSMASRNQRSRSAIDLDSAKKSRSKYQMNSIPTHPATPRPRKSIEMTPPPERSGGRTKNRSSQSQPTSRSTSPSPRLAYLYQNSSGSTERSRRIGSAIPSTSSSRDTSPSRGTLGRMFRSRGDRPPISPASRPVLAQKILQQSREAENALADVFKDSPENYRTPRKVSVHSDESETSSICSERSIDSRRQCYMHSWNDLDASNVCTDIKEIIALCASSTWQERKDGLFSLQSFMNKDNKMEPSEITTLTELFTKMFMDSHTKDLNLFLETLQRFIKNYSEEVHGWIYVLLQRIFLKIGTETLNSTKCRLMTLLEVIRAHFPIPLIIMNVHRFLADSTQTPSTQVKIVAMKFLTNLMHDLSTSGEYQFQTPGAVNALQKIINFSQDVKSTELRTAARNCVVAMWNLNTPQVTMMLSELPNELQDVASNIVQSHLRRSSTSSETNSPRREQPTSPLYHNSSGSGSHNPTSANGATGGASWNAIGATCNGSSHAYDHDEIYKSLKKTTTEIQNYNYENLHHNNLDRNRDTTSQDSGISQMSNHEEALMASSTPLKSSGSASMPFNYNDSNHETNGFRSLGVLPNDEDVVKLVIEMFVDENASKNLSRYAKSTLLKNLVKLIEDGNIGTVKTNFRKLLRVFLDCLNKDDSVLQIGVLEAMAAIFQNDDLKECWLNFITAITIRLVSAHHTEAREVAKQAEITASAMKSEAFEPAFEVLQMLILDNKYPTNLGAIKMLTKLFEAHPDKLDDSHLERIMPGLIRGADHNEIIVRKSAIFCLVALHKVIGEERLQPYLNELSVCKMRLVRMYIAKSEQER